MKEEKIRSYDDLPLTLTVPEERKIRLRMRHSPREARARAVWATRRREIHGGLSARRWAPWGGCRCPR